jgi:hypothetical protein
MPDSGALGFTLRFVETYTFSNRLILYPTIKKTCLQTN